MTTHSKIGASSYYRWSKCPGSVRLSEGIESKSSAYADEGTLAHKLAADWLITGKAPEMDEEMKEALQIYIDFVADERVWSDKILIEHKFHLKEVHPNLFGTADVVIYKPEEKILLVGDLKYGQGILVDADNDQLRYYAAGCLLSTGLPCLKIVLAIIQPRAMHQDGPIRMHTFDAGDILEFVTTLRANALATEAPDAPLVSGGHCRFCTAIGICPNIRDNALSVAQTEFSPVLSYNPIALAETLSKLDMLEAYAKGVRAFAYAEAEAGRPPPGFKLVEKRAIRKWGNQEEAEEYLSKHLDSDDLFDREFKSPAQIEKLLPKHKHNLLDGLVVKMSSGSTLVPDNDKRQKINSSASLDFTVITDKQSKQENT